MAFGQPYNPMGQSPYYQPQTAMPDQLAQLRAPYQAQPQMPMQPQSNGIVWVQGEAGAKSYMVGAGNSVLLMDSEGQTFYLKSADASGMPRLQVFDYSERLPVQKQTAPQPVQDFVTREEFNALLARLDAPAKKKAKEVSPDGEPAV